MASITTWTRLEPLPRGSDLEPGLEARIADPLWSLARQWQVGEFRGEDAGSPISASVIAEVSSVTRFLPGVLNNKARSRAIDVAGLPSPLLEPSIEAEAVVFAPGGRFAADSGTELVRFLHERGAPEASSLFVSTFPFEPAVDSAFGGRPHPSLEIVAGRIPDGTLVRKALPDETVPIVLGDVVAVGAMPGTQASKVVQALNEWRTWYDGFLVQPSGAGSWVDGRMEYAMALAARTRQGGVVLVSDEYTDGALDWHAFDARAGSPLGPPSQRDPGRLIQDQVIPTPVEYSGMPADRFWEMEDGRVTFGTQDAGPTDLARMLFTEFALVFGNDWFVIPLELPVGSVSSIISMEVKDTFGKRTRVRPVNAGGDLDPWSMFRLSDAAAAPRIQQLLFLPPTVASRLEGDAIEEVALFRDELANMVWAVERTVESASGIPVDRREEAQRAQTAPPSLSGSIGDAEILYRLMTPVPDHWIPFVPVAVDAVPGAIRLERRSMLRVLENGSTLTVEPAGRLLVPGAPLQLEEEEVPRSGAVVRRSYQYARAADGTPYLWVGRRKGQGRGEGSSGLRFDVVR